MSSVLINPQFQKSIDPVHYINHTYVLQCYLNPIVTTNVENKDFMVTPSKEMRVAIEVLLVYIMDGLLADLQDCLYKFKATIVDIQNKDEPWYSSCKKCSKKVKVIEHTVSCTNCNSENVEYEIEVRLNTTYDLVCGGEQRARVILFEAAKYLLGCNLQDYIESTSIKI
ncbi:hypothetical protein H5410_003687 [Solanum commersonii]|uniref:Replication factor A C-terminal domain-containing protein n=1 Tax=Solanum commersonii TaxID=4109 RepID=A0A9J6B5T1_SOLCO|nr:hypothetical protein H5410_003687 [Solanum commersonii]